MIKTFEVTIKVMMVGSKKQLSKVTKRAVKRDWDSYMNAWNANRPFDETNVKTKVDVKEIAQ